MRYTIMLFLIICIGCASPLESRDATPVFRTDTPRNSAESVHKIVIAASDTELDEYIAAPSVPLSLYAGWERLRRSLEESKQEEFSWGYPVKESTLSRFLGLAEARVGVPLPPFWEQVVLHARTDDCQNLEFGYRAGGWDVLHRIGWQYIEPSYDYDNECVLVRHGEQTYRLPIKYGDQWFYASIAEDKDTAYIALYPVWTAYMLHAVDRKTGKVRWSETVWSYQSLMIGAGFAWEMVEIVVRGDTVVVFGIPPLYVEAFDSKTGQNKWRFCTGYFEFEPCWCFPNVPVVEEYTIDVLRGKREKQMKNKN